MQKPAQFVLAAGVLMSWALPLRAAEHVTLLNGFEMLCHHHASVNGKVRLYTDRGNDNYIEVSPRDVASVDTVPDPPPAAANDGDSPDARLVRSAPVGVDGKLNAEDLNEMLAKAGQEHNVDMDLLASVVKAESNGNVHAVSRTGARGLMQLMPGTANDLGVADSFKPEQNVRGGSSYLDYLLNRYHDNLSLALAAYNAGPAAVDKYHGIPPYHETKLYVARVIHEFNRRVKAREAMGRRAVAAAIPAMGPTGN
ncbi:MAG TPA: lytic transglycosylase domain-containing protein [Terracidiphilus sp.]